MSLRHIRTKKVVIAIVCTVVAVLVIWVLYARLFAGDAEQVATSPDGRIVAQVRDYSHSAATDAAQLTIELKTRRDPFRHTAFLALNYGSDLRISWRDATTLQVSCSACGKLKTYQMDAAWREISIEYPSDLSRP
jgi:hypothetical protein